MTEAEKKEVLQGLTDKRDDLQAMMHEARGMRVGLQLGNIDKHRDFLQKIGELSFTFGAAIIPLVIVTNANKKIKFIAYVFIGVAVYLLNGLLALWKSKQIMERNADDAPYVGLDEEINTYPVINAHNKLLFDLENETYLEEFRQTSTQFLEWAPTALATKKPKVSVWLDLLLINFVLASLFIVRAVWSYSALLYWGIFAAILVFMIALTVISYIKSWQSQVLLQTKREKLATIKADYQQWHNSTVLKNKP